MSEITNRMMLDFFLMVFNAVYIPNNSKGKNCLCQKFHIISPNIN